MVPYHMKNSIMKLDISHLANAFVTIIAASWMVSCSDPSESVHKSTTSEAQDASLSASTAAAKPYVIRAESTIGFVGSKVTGSHEGGFKEFAGTIDVANGQIVGTPEIKIDMQSTWADNNRLTGHLKNRDFFEVETYPYSTFTMTEIAPSGEQQTVTGNLNLHGVTKSISFPADIEITDDELTVKTEFALNRKDFNINYRGMANDLVRDNVVIKLDIRATPGPARPEDQLAN